MNKKLVWMAIGIFLLEFISIGTYLLATLDWSWVTLRMIGIGTLVLVNFLALLTLILGLTKNE